MTLRRGIARAGLVLAVAGVMAAAGLTRADDGAAPARSTLQPSIPKARGGECVADPATMRRTHMDRLKHQRTETVHQGVRDPKSSLQACIACHASPETGSVAQAKTDFCVSCHSYAAVKIDCFECHASRPSTTSFLPLNHPRAANGATRLALQWRALTLPAEKQP